MEFPQIDPVAIALGPLQVHWYGLMYLIGFVGGWCLLIWRAGRPDSGWTRDQVSDLVFYVALGVNLGGRVGYVLFYNFGKFLDDPLWLFAIWTGGMSFHGGALGVLFAFWLLARKFGKRYFSVADFAVPVVPIGLGAGRFGNFINGELWGRPSDAPWAMVFPSDPMGVARHPSQLYEFFLEGIVLFLVLWLYSATPGRGGDRPVRGRLWPVADLRGVLPRARRAPGLSGRRLADHGHAAEYSHDRDRRRHDRLGLQARRPSAEERLTP